MTFLEAMRWVEEEHRFPDDPRHFHAERFRALAERSDLFSGLPPLVVVTGSCGKASTARFLACMLREAGYRVGLGTKPPLQETPLGHLERYQRLDSQGDHWLEPELFARLAQPLPELAASLPEALGPLAPYDLRPWILLRAFQAWGVDFGIVEANIGLRKDPAGALEGVVLTVVTPIATDHAALLQPPSEWEHLGPAAGPLWHKVSAVPSQRVVVGRQEAIAPEALDRLMSRDGPRWGRDFQLEAVASGLWGGRGRLRQGSRELWLEVRALGAFQVENAATAAVAFQELVGDQPEALRRGAAQCQLPGRLEVLRSQPLQLLCVASSLTKVRAMLDALEPLFSGPEAGLVVVLTLLDRVHGWPEVLTYLAAQPRLRAVVTTESVYPDGSRDVPAEELAARLRAHSDGLSVRAAPQPEQAVLWAQEAMRSEDVLLFLGNGLAAFMAGGGGA